MATKRDIVTDAFAELGLAEFIFDLQAEQLEAAKRSLDRMMALWSGQGIVVSYPLGANSDLDDETNTPDWAHDAMVLNLALRIAPGFGKTPSPDTRIAAGRAMNLLTKRRLSLQPMAVDTGAIPAGAGYYPGTSGVSNIYLQQPEDTLDDVSGPIGLE